MENLKAAALCSPWVCTDSPENRLQIFLCPGSVHAVHGFVPLYLGVMSWGVSGLSGGGVGHDN